MIEQPGDITVWMAEKRWVVIPTNIGWKRDGCNPMGTGVAFAAVKMYPDLAEWYGARCRKYGAETAVCPYYTGNLILLPTKPLDRSMPWASWRNQADYDLIKRGVSQLSVLADVLVERKITLGRIAVPLLGCGAGGLSRAQVVPIMRTLSDKFVLIERP